MLNRRVFVAHCSLWLASLPLAARAQAQARRRTVLVVGDSVSAEYGLPRGSGWVALLGKRLAAPPLDAAVVNASVSGDTTSGGRSRLPELLARHRPTHVILELGGNDALRGLPLSMTRDNLAAMTRAARNAGAKVLLLGMQVPPNYGRKYGDEFAALYVQVAQAQGAALVPFFFKGMADVPQSEVWFQADRIHPNEAAQPKLLDNAMSGLKPLL